MDDKTSNGRNYLSRGETIVNGVLIPDASGVYDIGSPTQRFKTVYADIEGNVSDPDISVNFIRFPYIGPNDLRMYRSAPKVLTLDDNASDAAALVVNGTITSNTATITNATISTITSAGTNILDLLGSLLTLTPGATQAILRGRLTADTQFRLVLDLTNGIQFGPGGSTALDTRLYRTAANTLTLDNNAGGSATLVVTNITSAGGTLSNIATLTRAGALAITTSSANGNITYTTNGSGNHVFNSTTGNVQINRPITTSAGDLTLNPAGSNIAMSSKNITGLANMTLSGQIDMGPGTSGLGTPKMCVFNNGGKYGFGIQPAVFSYETPNATDKHIFYTASTERMRLDSAGMLMSVPIGTVAGDLSLSPAGSNINCNNKTLTNVVSQTTTATNYSSANFSGTLAIKPYREGSIITLEFVGAVTCTTIANTWSATVALPAGYYNPSKAYQCVGINQTGTLSTCRILVNGTGIVSVSKIPISNFAVSEVLDLSNQCITFVAV